MFRIIWIAIAMSGLSFVGGNLIAQYSLYGTFAPHMQVGLVQKTELVDPQIYCYYDKNNHLIVPERSVGKKRIHMDRFENYVCQTDNERHLFRQVKSQDSNKETIILVENAAYEGMCLDLKKEATLRSNFLVDCDSLLQADKK